MRVNWPPSASTDRRSVDRLFRKQNPSQGEELHPVNPFFRFAGLCAEFKIGNGAPNGDVELRNKDDSPERYRLIATARRFPQEVGVMSNKDSPLSRGAVEQYGIFRLPSPILLCRDNIHAAEAQLCSNRPRDMYIHVKADVHLEFFKARSFWRSAGSESVGSSIFASW